MLKKINNSTFPLPFPTLAYNNFTQQGKRKKITGIYEECLRYVFVVFCLGTLYPHLYLTKVCMQNTTLCPTYAG